MSILSGSVVNVSVCISHISGTPILYTHKEENVSPDTAEVLPIYFDKPVKLNSSNKKLDIEVNVTGTGHGRGGDLTKVNSKQVQVFVRGSNGGGRAQVCFNLQNASQNCIISEIYFINESDQRSDIRDQRSEREILSMIRAKSKNA